MQKITSSFTILFIACFALFYTGPAGAAAKKAPATAPAAAKEIPKATAAAFAAAQTADLATLIAAQKTAGEAYTAAKTEFDQADEAMRAPGTPAADTSAYATLLQRRLLAKVRYENALIAVRAADAALAPKRDALLAADQALDTAYCKSLVTGDVAAVAFCKRRDIIVPPAVPPGK